MATPVSYFTHPDFPEDGFFFIQNTFFELPETIPMDLTSFIHYHFVSHRTLSGFIQTWDDIINTGTSLSELTFDEYYSENEKEGLFKDIIHTNGNVRAKKNRGISRKLSNVLNDDELGLEQKMNMIRELFSNHLVEQTFYDKSLFYPEEFYYSHHYLMNFFWEEQGILIDLQDEGNALAMVYLNSFLPLEFIPHKFRNSLFFKQEYVKTGKEFLIPENNSIETIEVDFVNDHKAICEVLKRHGDLYRYVDDDHANNVELFEIALSSCSRKETMVYPYADEEIRQNKHYKHLFSNDESDNSNRDDLPF